MGRHHPALQATYRRQRYGKRHAPTGCEKHAYAQGLQKIKHVIESLSYFLLVFA